MMEIVDLILTFDYMKAINVISFAVSLVLIFSTAGLHRLHSSLGLSAPIITHFALKNLNVGIDH
jgi:hypothetical protein